MKKTFFPIVFLLCISSKNFGQLGCQQVPGGFPYLENNCIAPIERYLARAVDMEYLSNENNPSFPAENDYSKYTNDIQTLVDLKASFIVRASATWGDDHHLMAGNNYTAMTTLVANINTAYDCASLPRPIIQAGIFNLISSGVDGANITIPSSIISTFSSEMTNLEGLYYNTQPAKKFKLNRIAYTSGPGQDNTYGTTDDEYCPDWNKLEGRMWTYYIAKCYIDAGYRSLHLGEIEAFTRLRYEWVPNADSASFKCHNAYTLCNKIRNYATSQGTFVLLTSEVVREYYDYNDVTTSGKKLVLDFNSLAMRPRDITNPMANDQNTQSWPYNLYGYTCSSYVDPLMYNNTPCSGSLPGNAVIDQCHRHFEQNGNGGTGPNGCVYSHTPYFIYFDFGAGITRCPEDHSTPDPGPTGVWGYSDANWFAELSDACQAYWLPQQLCGVRNFTDGPAFLQMPGRLILNHKQCLNGQYVDGQPTTYYRLYEHTDVKTAVQNAWAVKTPTISTSKTCPFPGDFPTYTITGGNLDCTSSYSIHIQKPNGSWEAMTYGTSRTYTPTTTGTHTIYLRQDNMGLPASNYGSQTVTKTINVVVCPCPPGHQCRESAELQNATSPIESSDFDFSISPNPSDGKLNLSFSTMVDGKASFEIYDVTNKKVFELTDQNVSSLEEFTKQVDISMLTAGFYIFKVDFGGIYKTTKLIKANN